MLWRCRFRKYLRLVGISLERPIWDDILGIEHQPVYKEESENEAEEN